MAPPDGGATCGSSDAGREHAASLEAMGDRELEIVEDALSRINDELPLLRRRMRHLGSIGFSRSRAAELAVSGIDVGKLEHLVGLGCPPETAVAIIR